MKPHPRSRRFTKNARRWLLRWLVLGAAALVGRLPLGAASALCAGLGGLAFFVCRRERNRTLEHLRLGLGDTLDERERRAVACRLWRNLGRSVAETVHLQWPDRLFAQVRIDFGQEERACIERAVAPGRGVLFLTAHLGNWELLSAFFARAGYPVNAVAKPLYDRFYEALIDRIRTRAGSRVHHAFGADALGMLRSLRRGEGLGILIDQRMGGDDILVRFFGHEAPTATGFAELALRTRASLLVGALLRTGPLSHRLVVRPLEVPDEVIQRKDVPWLVQEATAAVEQLIRQAPDQWMWMTRRWRAPSGQHASMGADAGAEDAPGRRSQHHPAAPGRLLVAAVFAALAAVGVWVVRYPLNSERVPPAHATWGGFSGVQQALLTGVEAVEWEEGRAAWRIRSASAVLVEAAGRIDFASVAVEVTDDKSGRIEAGGERGRAWLASKDTGGRMALRQVELVGAVTARNADGIRIESGRMLWDSTREAFWCPDAATIFRPAESPMVATDLYLYRDGRVESRDLRTRDP